MAIELEIFILPKFCLPLEKEITIRKIIGIVEISIFSEKQYIGI